jgi:uncharacterized protein YndB with AHSA1/START domain
MWKLLLVARAALERSATGWLLVGAHGSVRATMRLQDELGAVRRERVLPATRETAWELLADPRELEGWLADDVELDEVREGAEGVLRWDGGEERRVVVEEVVPARRIAMRWEDDRGGPDTLVEVTLDDDSESEGTIVRVVEVPLLAVRAVAATLGAAAAGRPSGPVALAA